MFSDIGQKIKKLASICTYIGIIGSCLGGLICMIMGISAEEGGMFFVGLLVAAVGSLLAWIGSFLLYGFGELIDTNTMIVDLMKKQRNKNLIDANDIGTSTATTPSNTIDLSKYSSEALYLLAYKSKNNISPAEKACIADEVAERGFIVDKNLIPFIDGLGAKSKAELERLLDSCHKAAIPWINAALNIGFYSDNNY